jgi:tetratricopeptide (TPR) repeat protein
MSDLKEEAAVDESQIQEKPENRKKVDPSMEGLQLFYEKNKKAVNYIGGGLLVLIGAIVFFKLYYIPEQEKEATNEIFWAESYFEKDSFNIALKGGKMVMSPDGQKSMMGFEQVAEDYSMTKTGNLANYYAGICNLRLGKFSEAIEQLKKYDNNDIIVSAVALGAIGDCNMELKNLEEAIKYYQRAVDKSENSFTAPYYLRKLAVACELKGDFAHALEAYERIEKEYTTSSEGREIAKRIARVKALGHLQ